MIQEYEVKAGVTFDAAASGGRWGRVGPERKGGGGAFKRGVDWTWGVGVGVEDGCRGSIMCWLQCAEKVICCVRSRL